MERPIVTIAVEGSTDEAAVKQLAIRAGFSVGPVHIYGGKPRLVHRLPGLNSAARHSMWLVVRDLDRDAACAPELVARLLPDPAALMCFRLAVRAVEAWLLADRQRMAQFLGVPVVRIAENPDILDDPKTCLVNLARHSRLTDVRRDLVPAHGTSARVGPGYTARMIEFAQSRWRPSVAAMASPSLAGCLRALGRLRRRHG